MKLKNRILPFYQAIPQLLKFQAISLLVLAPVTLGVSLLCSLLLGLSGKAAVTSGDLGFLFTHWQGYVMILLTLLMVLCYVAVELNALVIYCSRLLDGDTPSVWRCIKEGFAGLRKYLSLRGLVIVIYAAILAPILGLGFSISLTGTFYIPRFIMSVIQATPLFMTGYIIVMALLLIVALVYCFILHGALTDGMTMKEASVNSRKLVAKNWKNFLFEVICYSVLSLLAAALIVLVFFLPLFIVQLIPMAESVLNFLNVFFSLLLTVAVLFTMLETVSFVIIKLTMLYKKYASEGEWTYEKREKKHHPVMITVTALVVVLCIVLSISGTTFFDILFPSKIDAEIIGHRAGGVEAPENTVKGIDVAYELGAKGCEIDIQRTSDGYYVVNHDADFERVAGVSKKPSEMTLSEVKELSVDGEPVPTLEEMLDASKDKVILFVELKGETADEQMADDAVRIIKEKGMQDQAVLISLKLDVLEYIEQKYPEMQTGYLAFISFGQIEDTPFDYLALEEEIATDDTIAAVHAKGKKLIVWTVNDEDDIEEFLTSEADAIITDSVKLSAQTKERLMNRKPYEIILQKTLSLLK
ncbi:MAG: glycerophosphoryl diester phosphodiesterase membrane domain-containing protein [Ruminococcus sp.]|nr:glycerophosphoryl diester phosphodiesterase membrane domain-containing protein [Ruminococcus sp.]